MNCFIGSSQDSISFANHLIWDDLKFDCDRMENDSLVMSKKAQYTKNLIFEIGFAPIFIKYKNLSEAYNLFFGIGIESLNKNLFFFNYFIYNRFDPYRTRSENDNYFSINYYFIKSKGERLKNYLGLQLGYLYSFGSSKPNSFYPNELEFYKMNFYSLGIANYLSFRINEKHSLNLLLSLDIGVLNQSLTKKNQNTGEILSHYTESFIDGNIFKPIVITYSYKL